MPVTWPNVASPKLPFGLPKFGWLKALNASARSSARPVAEAEPLHERQVDFQNPGPSIESKRFMLPQVFCSGAEKTDVSK